MQIKTTLVAALLAILSACNTGKNADATGMFVKQGDAEWQVADAQLVADFKQAMSGKQRVILKQLPRFTYQVWFLPEDAKAIWYLSNNGYVTRTPDHGDAIYRINFNVNRLHK